MSSVYEYTEKDFILKTEWNARQKSNFDSVITEKWKMMQEKGDYFKYKFKIDHSKILPGKYGYLAQLNVNRALLRRKHAEIQSMSQVFDPNTFNFTKMDKKEILFEIVNRKRNNKGDYVVINVSPLEFGHCLLLPALHSCLPQVVTPDSLLSAVEIFLLSSSPAFRMGFNGLCAYASLNHLHFHLYYLEQQMLLETIEVDELSGPCHVLLSFPSRGFVFQLAPGQDVEQFVRTVFKLVDFLRKSEKPHNILITRGTSFQEKSPSHVRDHVRLYVWVRKPVCGPLEATAFHPALCEMFGQLQIKTTEEYEGLTEDAVSNIMSDLTVEPFHSVVDQVKHMFQES